MKKFINIIYWIIAVLPYLVFLYIHNRVIPDSRFEFIIILLISLINFSILIFLHFIYKKNSLNNYYRYSIMFIVTVVNILILFGGRSFMFSVSIPKIISFLCGVVFLIFGISMPKIKYNKVIGIKTKWTLSNEKVWIETHKISGITWIGGGILAIINIFSNSLNMYLCILGISLLLVIIIPCLFSWLYWKKLKTL